MKKIITTIAISGIAFLTFAQGTVNWVAPVTAFIGQTNATVYSTFVSSTGSPVGGTSGNTVGGGTSLFYYELLVSASVSSVPTTLSTLTNNWLDTGLQATNGPSANGRISMMGSSSQAIAANWPASTVENLIMVGWSADLGTTYAAMLGNLSNWAIFSGTLAGAPAYFGVGTSVGSLASQSGNPGVTVFGSNAGQVNDTGTAMQMDLLSPAAVPEPTTMALAALGGASLLLFRRRKV